MNRFTQLACSTTLLVLGLLTAASPNVLWSAPRVTPQVPPPQLPTPAPTGGASAQIGQPNATATVTFTVKMTYIDAQGVKQKEKFEAKVNVKPGNPDNDPPSENGPVDAPDEKAAAFAQGLNDEILADATAKEWPFGLGLVSSVGNLLNINPGADAPGGEYRDVKIVDVESSDERTGEKDRISNASALALGEAQIFGDITGLVGESAGSWLWVATNLGEVQITLSAQMRRGALLRDVRDQLEALGLNAWHDSDRDAVLVMLDEEVTWFGASSNDNGLRVTASVSYP